MRFLTIIIVLLLNGCARKKIKKTYTSYFNVSLRKKYLNNSVNKIPGEPRGKISCESLKKPEPINYFIKIPPYYEDHTGYKKATQPFKEYGKYLAEITARYVSTQNIKYSNCLLFTLKEWAIANAFFHFDYDGNKKQAWYEIDMALSATAMAYSIIKSSIPVDKNDSVPIENWLRKVALKQISFPGGPNSCCNNHAYWRGLTAISVGVVSQDEKLFSFGIQKYKDAIDSLNVDGSFPREMMRGRRAIHYQNFAIWPLIYIAEFAYHQGVNIYNYRSSKKNIHLAISFFIRSLNNDKLITLYTKEKQDLYFFNKGWALNWMEPYNARFPSIALEKILVNKRPIAHPYGGGYSTLFFYRR